MDVTADVTAILGPTNTGKTHRAVERLLSHPSGIIGLPLRLLAREVYDRISARTGEASVALVTGEEKRVPARPRYWVSTVEAMPTVRTARRGRDAGASAAPGAGSHAPPTGMEVDADIVIVDEVQLAAHPERGHVFTDRVLHARGARETLLLGADTIRPLLARLVPGISVESQPRLSTLTGAGGLGLGALPPRTAVVAFSAARVYELAERLRGRRGGAAVVLGALSPRARNAQVALYQAGEVDYLVATDAIGMGLNMDIDCVAFADLTKFDGRRVRALEVAELAQIAGRAGRHHRDGRFATLAPLAPLPPPVIRAIEQHRFPPEQRLYWRPHVPDLSSPSALLVSLRARPPAPWLATVHDAEDLRALDRLSRREEVAGRADGPARVALLWQVCQVPDYRQLQLDDHLEFQALLFQHLTTERGRLPSDWIARNLASLLSTEGDIDTLLARMAGVRTWTYVCHQSGWVDDPSHWQERTRTAEDRLSDALHERLVERFVDGQARRRGRAERPAVSSGGPRAAPAAAAARASAPLSFAEQLRAQLGSGGNRLGAAVGVDSPSATPSDRWINDLVDAEHARFRPDPAGYVLADGARVARLVGGVDLLHPEVTVLDGDRALGAGARLRLGRRLLAWTRDLVNGLLAPLREPPRSLSERLSTSARGLFYQLERGLGTIAAGDAAPQVRGLADGDRAALRKIGVRVGQHVIFLPALLSADALAARFALCNAYLASGGAHASRIEPPRHSAPSLRADPDVPAAAYAAIGYPVFGARAIRADLVDGIAARLHGGAGAADVASRLGCRVVEVPSVVDAFLEAGSASDDEAAPRSALR